MSTLVRRPIVMIAVAVLLVISGYAAASAIDNLDGLGASASRSAQAPDTARSGPPRPAASPDHPVTPSPVLSFAPGGPNEYWQFRAPRARAVPVVPSPGAGDGPVIIENGPFGTIRTTNGNYAALTFDDGPDPRWTPQVLELLRTHGVRATFCVLGQAVESNPDLLRAIVDDGHTLCNHSWSHDMALGQRSRAEIRNDLLRTTAAIHAAVPDAPVSYYRQPGGYWTARVVEVAADLGMTSVHWDVDPRDWSTPGVDTIVARVTSQTQPGSIVLLHDGDGDQLDGTSDRQQTVDALARILPQLTDRLTLHALPPHG